MVIMILALQHTNLTPYLNETYGIIYLGEFLALLDFFIQKSFLKILNVSK